MKLTLPRSDKGRPWTLRVVRRDPIVDGEPAWGYCWAEKRQIVISQAAREHGVAREILIHEMLHKLMPFLTEEAVEHLAIELDSAIDFAESRNILDL